MSFVLPESGVVYLKGRNIMEDITA